MTTLLRQLVDYALIFYIGCAIGIIFYVFRALAAQRERGLAMFTLERETATAQIARAWLMVAVFVVITAIVFVSTTFVVPALVDDLEETAEPTNTPVGGLVLPPGITPTPSPTLGPLVLSPTPTFTPTPTPTLPPPPEDLEEEPPTEAPTPELTEAPPTALTGEVYARFGDVGELVGFALSAADVSPDQTLELTLYWRGVDNDNQVNYLVFTHLLSADGRLIGQHDGAPASGARPTSAWAAGETVADVHPMTFSDAGYAGPARIAVGLYEPGRGRMTTQTGEDAVVLPVTINVTP